MTRRQPPRLAQWLLERSLPEPERTEIPGDLAESFERHSRWKAARYWMEALNFAVRYLPGQLGHGLPRDFRHGLRLLTRTPAFSLVVILTLALGIGANTAIFSLIYGILLRPFPYRDHERLVRVQTRYLQTGDVRGNSALDFEDWRARSRMFDDMGLYAAFQSDLQGEGVAQAIGMAWVTPSLFSTLGVHAIVGRNLRPEEGIRGGPVHKILISHRLWQTQYGSDPEVIGKSIRLPQTSYTVVGVMPPGFLFPSATDVWAPLASGIDLARNVTQDQLRGSRFYSVIARLKPGVSLAQAQSELESISAALEQSFPGTNRGVRPSLITLRDSEVGNIRPYLFLLGGAVVFVLLICCVNAANLLLARSAVRAREISIRASLGAGRAAIVRQLLVESVLLALLGGAAGVALGALGLRGLLALIPVSLPFWMRIELDPAVLLFTAATSLATSLLFGLAPAWHAADGDFAGALKEGARGTSGSSGLARLRRALVVAEVALSLLLLVGAGLLMRSFASLEKVRPGFEPNALLTAHISPFRKGTLQEKRAAYASLYRSILQELSALPGVIAVGGADPLPYTKPQSVRPLDEVAVLGEAEDKRRVMALTTASVSPDYFHSMEIPVLQGRAFRETDGPDAPPVAILSARAATRLFGKADAIGKQIRAGRATDSNPWCTVAGIAGNVRSRANESDEGAEVYFPYTQRVVGAFDFVVRVHGQPSALAGAIREAISRVDKDTAVTQVVPLTSLMADALWQQRLWSFLFLVFAAVALTLAVIGLYGVLAFLVAQRRREIGIRMALGARSRSVLGMVAGMGMRLTVIGLALGMALSLIASRVMTGLLYGVSPLDWATFLGMPVLLAFVSMVACLIPAWRATRIDPLKSLRQD
jgi:putative ABC transport system permease protein